jgi:putative endonuclease
MYVYVLYSRSLKKYYVGQTADFDARLSKHNKGGSKFTKRGAPWEKVWLKDVENRSSAVLLERKIKARGAKRYLADIDFEIKID